MSLIYHIFNILLCALNAKNVRHNEATNPSSIALFTRTIQSVRYFHAMQFPILQIIFADELFFHYLC